MPELTEENIEKLEPESESEPKDNSLDLAKSPHHKVKISSKEWLEISLALEQHHAVFYKVWQMGRPIFNEDIPTAAVQFDDTGNFIWFHFNPVFWKRLDFYLKLFVISHEALHIILNHGIRIKDAGINRGAANRALDIVVNHNLVRGFGFDRQRIDDGIKPIIKQMVIDEGKPWGPEQEENNGLCWVDTVFKNKKPLPASDEMFEYYYNLFDKVYGDGGPGDGSGGSGPQTLDDHSYMGEQSDAWGPVIDELNESLSAEEKESLKGMVNKHFQNEKNKNNKLNSPAGSGTGGQWVFANITKVKKKKKWETVIKRWSRKYLIEKDKDFEQWARLNRRLTMLPRNMFLPSEMEVEEEEKDKTRIKVYFYMDTSGSCWGLKDRFFAAAASLPEDRFDVRLLCFDTQIQETTLASKKIYGGGGTSFKILEDFIQKEVNQGGKYPEGVFVITDGYGDNIKPERPDKWYWFLTPGATKSYIHPDCNFFNLEDFE